MPPLPFRAAAFYLILGRYVMSYQTASAVLGRNKERGDEHHLPVRPTVGQLEFSAGCSGSWRRCDNGNHRHSSSIMRVLVRPPLVLRGSNNCFDEDQRLRDDNKKIRRRRRIFTWLPQMFKSVYRRLFTDWWSSSLTPTAADPGGAVRADRGPPQETSSRTTNSTLLSSTLLQPTTPLSATSPLGTMMMSQQDVALTVTTTTTDSNQQPDRTATANSFTDLTGQWRLLVTSDFKRQYDKYLTLLGQPVLVRTVALSIIGMTTEETRQDEHGRQLWIRGTNPRGAWERVLTASTDDDGQKFYSIRTIDNESVQAEAWWGNDGTMHNSWLRGVSKYGGGSFESIRYLESPDVLVCESAFHPDDKTREVARVTWRFARTASSSA